MTTQRKLLLDHLRKSKSISSLEALYLYRIAALPRRIKDLEERGYSIGRERKTDETGRPYTRYYLVDEANGYDELARLVNTWIAPGGSLGAFGSLGKAYAEDLAA